MLLGSSGVVKRVKSPLKNVCDSVDGFGLWWILISNSAFIQSVLGQAFSLDG
jgi:hypothetical protein